MKLRNIHSNKIHVTQFNKSIKIHKRKRRGTRTPAFDGELFLHGIKHKESTHSY